MTCFRICDPAGTRTQDPNIKSVMLYQLSYEIGFKPLRLKWCKYRTIEFGVQGLFQFISNSDQGLNCQSPTAVKCQFCRRFLLIKRVSHVLLSCKH